MKQHHSSFKWRHFEPTIILLCVRWYCRYQLSYRDLEEMMRERGLAVDHVTRPFIALNYFSQRSMKGRPLGGSFRVVEAWKITA